MNLPKAQTTSEVDEEGGHSTDSAQRARTPWRSGEVPIPVSIFERQGNIPGSTNSKMVDAVQVRVASNILLHSGYVTNLHIGEESATGNIRSEAMSCVKLHSKARTIDGLPAEFVASIPILAQQYATHPQAQAQEDEWLMSVTLAVVAVEKFNRNSFQRRLEWLWATKMLSTFGWLPDLSLGPAQLRPSTVRRLLKWDGATASLRDMVKDDRKLVEALMDECQALRISAAVLSMNTCKDCNDPAQEAARLYAGQRRRTHAAIDYVPVVMTIASMLR